MKIALLIISMVLGLCGCSQNYYWHTINGHFEIYNKRIPIDQYLDSISPDHKFHGKLRLALSAREFAYKNLAMEDSGSYVDFVDLERPYAVYIVVAAPELSLVPNQWCYIVAGCFSYRGFFDLTRAQSFYDEQKALGNDVYLSPVRAYSTLGWFSDPITSAMLTQNDLDLVGVIIHELAHEKFYISDDTAFNEAFATAVETIGKQKWVASTGFEIDKHSKLTNQYWLTLKALLLRTRDALIQLYHSNKTDDQKRMMKSDILEELQHSYLQLKREWSDWDGFDHYMSRDMNNAKLALLGTYESMVPYFISIYEHLDKEISPFYGLIEKFSCVDAKQRYAMLKDVAEDVEKLKIFAHEYADCTA